MGNLWMFFQPWKGWRKGAVTERRSGKEFAYRRKFLVDELFPEAEVIRAVYSPQVGQIGNLPNPLPHPASRRLAPQSLPMQMAWSSGDNLGLPILTPALSGFHMAHIPLQHADRIEHLLLAMAIATLWCHELGEHVLQQGEAARRLTDPGPTRELSLFQPGLQWLKRVLAVAIHLLPNFKARLSNLNLPPVLSPLAQNEKV